nr:immunoglobulin heavy chain junction region [Mus musculus]
CARGTGTGFAYW